MKRILLLVLTLIIVSAVNAQTDNSTQIPADPAYRIGKLGNGLTYYIRHNTEPAGRASYYIIQNVGSILEKDSQNGLAHFLEHMAFNGTKHFPDKMILNSLARHGVAFGYNINAYTSWDETVYNLSDVPVDKPGLVDTCLTILADWSDYITLSDLEINKERGVIVEEWRTGRDASRRMLNQILPVIFEGSQYAVRDIIGDTLVIKYFPTDTLRAFYHDWYRTDLQAIAIVGDIDVDAVEAKVKDLFSSIPSVANPAPRPETILNPKKGTTYLLATDPEASETSLSLIILDPKPDRRPKDMAYVRDGFVIDLMNAMMRNRISEIVQKGTPPFVSASVNYRSFIARNYNALTAMANARENEEAKAFEAILTELERARRFGFTQGELDRARATMMTNFESYYKQKDKIKNDAYVNEIQDNFLNGEPIPSLDVQLEFYRNILPTISAAEITERLKNLITEDNRFILVEAPSGQGHLSESEALALVDKVKNSDIKPYQDIAGGNSLINEELKGSPVVKTKLLPEFSAVEWTLANGAKVVFRKADYEKDNVTLSGFANGGTSVYADSLVPSYTLFPGITSMYGAGEFDNVTLQKMLAGKKASVALSLQETIQTISGSSTPKDFETMMQLLYLRFARPNFSREAYDAIVGRYTAVITSMQKDPNKQMSDSLSEYLTSFSPRNFILTPESMKKIRFEDVNYIYKTSFDDASRFTFFITGNIEEATAQQMAEKYVGSLPSLHIKKSWVDRKVRQPEGIVKKEISIPLAVPKATVVINYSSKMKYVPVNYLSMEALQGILDLVYTEKIREEEGGTYGVGINSQPSKRPVEKSVLTISFDCDPERATALKAIVYKELQDIATNGPSQVNLDKAVSNMLKKREEAIPHNNYWAGAIRNYYLTGINSNDPKNFDTILKNLTVSDMKKTVSKYLKDADLLEIVFVPEKNK